MVQKNFTFEVKLLKKNDNPDLKNPHLSPFFQGGNKSISPLLQRGVRVDFPVIQKVIFGSMAICSI